MDTNITELSERLTQWGATIEMLPGQVSPHTGNGSNWASADWHWETRTYKVYFPVGYPFHGIYHELLHLVWAGIEGAGCLEVMPGVDSRVVANIAEFNNDLDHAIVIPREIAIYPDAAGFWQADLDRTLRETNFDDRSHLGTLKCKMTLFRGWLVLPHALPNYEITAEYRRRLSVNGWLEAADRMTAGVQQAGRDKMAAVRHLQSGLALDYLNESYCFQRTL